MIAIRTNTQNVLGTLVAKINALKNIDPLLRTLATNTRASMKRRIHVDGLDSNETAIGQYSDPYMKIRTLGHKVYLDNLKKSTRESISAADQNRKTKKVKTSSDDRQYIFQKYNRNSDKKVVISLTRQMENDMVVVATAKGYGIGYNNAENAKKVGYVENTYNKKIFGLTKTEIDNIKVTARDYIKRPSA